tara:strand:- start:1934 stop:2089 length:156 start_codon:yes stop_codon:yes gene_type:complete
MPPEIFWLICFIVAMLVGPFAALRAFSVFRRRRDARKMKQAPASDRETDST